MIKEDASVFQDRRWLSSYFVCYVAIYYAVFFGSVWVPDVMIKLLGGTSLWGLFQDIGDEFDQLNSSVEQSFIKIILCSVQLMLGCSAFYSDINVRILFHGLLAQYLLYVWV